jgi:small-conductance mechanosensitive channel/CRP-like cAMP-binding protein
VTYLLRLFDEAKDDLSFVLLAALVVVGLMVQTAAHEERRRLRGMAILTALHLVLLPVLAGLRAEPTSGWYTDVRLAALVFEVMAFVGMAGSLLFAVTLPRLSVRAPRILRDVLSAAAGVIAIIAVANRLGFPLSGVITTSAVLTAVIGFSLQDTLGNVMGGLALQMDNSVGVGDWVKVGDLRGRVAEIRWRYTAIETRNWETVIVPNGVLMKGQVIVEGRRAGQPIQTRRWVYFNVDFRYQPSDVIAAVNEALQAAPIERVATQPQPHCILMDLSESYGRYAVRYWLTELAVDDPTDSVVRTRIYFALKRANIPLSIPAHAVFMTEENVERKQEKSRQDHERRLKALAAVDLFDSLADEAMRDRLADMLRYAPFCRGEAMTRQGAEGHWLYMIIEGEASVRVAAEGVEKEVARIGAGKFFGEMSLMTGARRTATVVALDDVECYRLDKPAFQRIIHERPELADEISAVLASRKASLLAAQEGLDHDARERRLAEEKRAILHKIRDFFGLANAQRVA